MLYVSPTSITTFLSCPSAFQFRQSYSIKDQKIIPGILVHKALEKGKCPKEPSVVASQCAKLQGLMQAMNIKILEREVYQRHSFGS